MVSTPTSTPTPTTNASRRPREKATDKAAFKVHLKIPMHRNTRYKEKFQALRERYDQVAAVHDAHERDLEIAAQKMKCLQAENDLLLDAIHITAPHLVHLATPIQAATPEQNLNGSRRPPPEQMTPRDHAEAAAYDSGPGGE